MEQIRRRGKAPASTILSRGSGKARGVDTISASTVYELTFRDGEETFLIGVPYEAAGPMRERGFSLPQSFLFSREAIKGGTRPRRESGLSRSRRSCSRRSA